MACIRAYCRSEEGTNVSAGPDAGRRHFLQACSVLARARRARGSGLLRKKDDKKSEDKCYRKRNGRSVVPLVGIQFR